MSYVQYFDVIDVHISIFLKILKISLKNLRILIRNKKFFNNTTNRKYNFFQ